MAEIYPRSSPTSLHDGWRDLEGVLAETRALVAHTRFSVATQRVAELNDHARSQYNDIVQQKHLLALLQTQLAQAREGWVTFETDSALQNLQQQLQQQGLATLVYIRKIALAPRPVDTTPAESEKAPQQSRPESDYLELYRVQVDELQQCCEQLEKKITPGVVELSRDLDTIKQLLSEQHMTTQAEQQPTARSRPKRLITPTGERRADHLPPTVEQLWAEQLLTEEQRKKQQEERDDDNSATRT